MQKEVFYYFILLFYMYKQFKVSILYKRVFMYIKIRNFTEYFLELLKE